MFDDVRLTLAGTGDPMLADNVGEIIEAAVDAGVYSIRIETDFLEVDAAAAATVRPSSSTGRRGSPNSRRSRRNQRRERRR